MLFLMTSVVEGAPGSTSTTAMRTVTEELLSHRTARAGQIETLSPVGAETSVGVIQTAPLRGLEPRVSSHFARNWFSHWHAVLVVEQ